MKKIFTFILTLMVTQVLADEITVVATGNNCGEGDKCVWTVTSDGKLTISGTGIMKDYGGDKDLGSTSIAKDFVYQRPWQDYVSQITDVVVQKGIEYVGNRSFEFMNSVETITFENGITNIGSFTHSNMDNIKKIIMPESIEIFKSQSEPGSPKLSTIYCSIKSQDICKSKYGSKVKLYTIDANGKYTLEDGTVIYQEKKVLSQDSDRIVRRIYTIDEATALVSQHKGKNTFSIRYR